MRGNIKQFSAAEAVVVLGPGATFRLSPGEHNRLAACVIREFLPRFAPAARVLYLGDKDHRALHVDEVALVTLGVPATRHGKLSDIVLYDEARSWLFLVEAVSSHGPVSAKRYAELEEALRGCKVGRVYVSAFPSFREFTKYAAQVAWETEVWIAEEPAHSVHYNGDRFLGPR